MRFKITKRKSLCDKNSCFYDLYVDGTWLCGFNNLKIIKIRKEMYKKNIPIGNWYESKRLFKKYHLNVWTDKKLLKKWGRI